MNPSEAQTASPPTLGFKLMGGALAGFLFAAEVSLLQSLIWAIGGPAGMRHAESLRLSLITTTTTLLYCLVTGLLAGLVWAVLPSRITGWARQSATQWLPALWVVLSFLWVVSGPVHVILALPAGLVEALLTLAIALTAYFWWRLLLQWLTQGQTGRLIGAICGTGLALWIPFGVYLVLR